MSNVFRPNISLHLGLYAPASLQFKIKHYKLSHDSFMISLSCIICSATFVSLLTNFLDEVFTSHSKS